MKKSRNQKSQRENTLQNRKNSTPAVATHTTTYVRKYMVCLLKDAALVLEGYSNADSTRDIKTFHKRYDAEGLSFVTKTLPILMTGLFNLLESGVASFPGFKLKRGMEYPKFLGGMFRLALESTDLRVKSKAFDVLYSFTTAFKKLRGDYPESVLLKQFTDFIKTDQKSCNLHYFQNERSLEIMRRARQIITNICGHFDLEELRQQPRPGPGAVNTRMKKGERYRPRTLYKQIDDVLSYQEWWYVTPWHACLRSREFLSLYNSRKAIPTARFKFVPKTMDKPRGICIEENEMQVMQQCVRQWFYDVFKRLEPNIAITKQHINANLALESSITQENATIDMSEGSDRIFRNLVSWLFQHCGELHTVLMALSTRVVEPPTELQDVFPAPIPLNKYAPMGSALCFPVMTLVHYALVTSICEASTDNNEERLDMRNRIYVYGDDIVLPSKYAPIVFKWLPIFGMKLNKTKSFYRSHFRESCGIHAFHGVDVTPVYIKYVPVPNNAKALTSAFAVERQLYNKGLFTTAEFQRQQIREQAGYNPVQVAEGTSFAGFIRPFSEDDLRHIKYNFRRKWSHRYQCSRYTLPQINAPIIKSDVPSDDDAYLRWLWTRAENPGKTGDVFGDRYVGDSAGDLKFARRNVLESALTPQTIGLNIDKALKKVSNLRPVGKRCDVRIHKIVLRQCGYLQQLGAAECCVWC